MVHRSRDTISKLLQHQHQLRKSEDTQVRLLNLEQAQTQHKLRNLKQLHQLMVPPLSDTVAMASHNNKEGINNQVIVTKAVKQ